MVAYFCRLQKKCGRDNKTKSSVYDNFVNKKLEFPASQACSTRFGDYMDDYKPFMPDEFVCIVDKTTL